MPRNRRYLTGFSAAFLVTLGILYAATHGVGKPKPSMNRTFICDGQTLDDVVRWEAPHNGYFYYDPAGSTPFIWTEPYSNWHVLRGSTTGVQKWHEYSNCTSTGLVVGD